MLRKNGNWRDYGAAVRAGRRAVEEQVRKNMEWAARPQEEPLPFPIAVCDECGELPADCCCVPCVRDPIDPSDV